MTSIISITGQVIYTVFFACSFEKFHNVTFKLPVDLVFGVGHWTNEPAHVFTQRELLQALHKHNIKFFDTARHYVRSSIITFRCLLNINRLEGNRRHS